MERLVGLSSLLYTTTFRFNKWNLLLCAFRDYNWIEGLLCARVVQNVTTTSSTLSTYFSQYPTVYLVQYELSSYSVY